MTTQTKPRILYAEDIPGFQRTISRVLSREYDLDLASNTDEALLLSQSRLYDLIMTDLDMGDSYGPFGGYHLASKIREKDKEIPIILFSATDGLTLEEVLSQGFNYFLKKPADLNEIKDAIKQCIAERKK